MRELTRREFLKLLGSGALVAASGLAPRVVQAFGDSNKFRIFVLDYPGADYGERLSGLKQLCWEVIKRTSVEPLLSYQMVSPSSDAVFDSPFLYMFGTAQFPEWDEEWVLRLRRFLSFGGFLLIDSDGSADAGFDASVRREFARIFPGNEFKKLPKEHTVYKSFYLINEQAGRVITTPYLEGIDLDDRSAVIYSRNDLAGAWARDPFGNWSYEVVPGGERQREMAFRLGVNIVMYALCVNYKSDQVHIPFILRRRR